MTRTFQIADFRLQIVDGANRQLGGNDESHQAIGPDGHSCVPNIAAASGRAHYQPATSTLRNVGGRELLRGLPGSLYCRLRFQPGLVLEEADETLFWLELLVDAGVARREEVNLT